MNKVKPGKIIIPAGVRPWPHELHVAEILAEAGYSVKFLSESNIKTADIQINKTRFELKSPKSAKSNSLEHIIKKALKQSPNIIIDISRIKRANNTTIKAFLMKQIRSRKQIKKLLLVTKSGEIIDIQP